MTKEEILVKNEVLHCTDPGVRFNLLLSRDGHINTVKYILDAMEEYGRQCAHRALDMVENEPDVDHDTILKLKERF